MLNLATTERQCFGFGQAAMSALDRLRNKIPLERSQRAIDDSKVMDALVMRGLVGEPNTTGALGVDPFPKELTSAVLVKAATFGLHPVFFPDQEIAADRKMPEGWVKPEAWFYQNVASGKIPMDAIRLYPGWYLVDCTLSVDYADGKQVFPNDPLAPIITRLRKERKIGKNDATSKESRFTITHDEWIKFVCPTVAAELEFDPKRVRLERAIEFNFVGNMYDRKRGTFNAWEWFNDSFEGSCRLCGGYRGRGGLARVICAHREYRYVGVAGRPLVSFS